MSAETLNGATIIDVKQQVDDTLTEMSKSTASASTDNEHFWKNFAENVYTAEKLPISIDLLQTLLVKIENCSEHILDHELDYETFYTALISFTSLQLIELVDACKSSLDQIEFNLKKTQKKLFLLKYKT